MSNEQILSSDGLPLEVSLKKAERRNKIRAVLLVAPLFLFILIIYVFPIGEMLFRSIDDRKITGMLPKTFIAMENCIKDTIEYCTERKAFGKSILDNQVVHFRLAELQTELEALRALTYKACDRFVDGKDVTMLASMAKLKSGRLIREVSDSCLQFWGGMGYTMENPVSQQFRDGRLHSIGGGSDEVMLQIISKYMNTLPKKS